MGRREFESVEVGDALPPRAVPVGRADLVRYAGVSGDLNPLHWDDAIAARLGLDSVVAHGMFTMGVGAGYVCDWVGDPGAMLDVSVRFTSPVLVPPFPGQAQVELTGKVKSADPDTRTVVVALQARSAGKKVFGRATATVQLA
ncbi:MaoC/PaaZ C-terminal domain-containing protein [Tomitella fengzijianii]|uniref:3-hydroxyacyl-ACP dehydratase n=1 Tax=Tomitella fengzijianii TaxID=2597660 RepID=A0A516X7F2_9ACTN|nr:MaoC/PaaZ C-terminal domain-containing protein [Tomitella fengzijianii]QDQ98994.1 3-hydroxyacyl-ACP dehydratase [Tomitella fengzijianii]